MPAVTLRLWKPSCVNLHMLFFLFLIVFLIALISLYVIAGVLFAWDFIYHWEYLFSRVGLVSGLFLSAFSALVFGLYSKMLDLLYIMFRHIHRCLKSKDFELQAPLHFCNL